MVDHHQGQVHLVGHLREAVPDAPPWASTIPLQMARPRPDPPVFRPRSSLPSRENFLNRCGRLQLYTAPTSPNPGWPLPGHVMTNADTAPGAEVWERFHMSENDW